LLPTPSHAPPNSRSRKDLLLVFFGLLFLSSLVAFGSYRASNVPHAHVSSPTSNHQQEQQSPTSLPSSKWRPVSRGVSSGVSEKSSNMLFSSEGGASEAFPWDNSMLSWQRTSFHFQPEKNWMNGNSFLSFCFTSTPTNSMIWNQHVFIFFKFYLTNNQVTLYWILLIFFTDYVWY